MTAWTTPRLPWSRFVALGDSVTEGIGDPAGLSLRGWADRLAAALRELDPQLQYWNLARRSLKTAEVRDTQLARALELEADLASVVAGMNDVLGTGFDAAKYRDELVSIVQPLLDSGANVLVGTLPGELPLFRLMPRQAAGRIRDRLAQLSDVVREVAAEFGAVCVDAPAGWRYGMSECSIDGCHPNARGHAHIAQIALDALCERAGLSTFDIRRRDQSLLTSRLMQAYWLASEGYLRLFPQALLRLKQGRT